MSELHECNYNWKTFIEVYLEDYHVGPFHPGLGNFVTCDDLQWELGKQLFGANRGRGRHALASPAARCTNAGMTPLLDYRNGEPPKPAPSGSPTTRTSWWSGTRTC